MNTNKLNLRTIAGTSVWRAGCLFGVVFLMSATQARAQEAAAGEKMSLKRAVKLGVQNSRELALARLRHTIAEQTAGTNRAQFRPNLYTGSGAAYTNGFPQTPGGGAPSVFNMSYIQTMFDGPLRGQLRAAEERAEARRVELESVRDAVIVRTASAYLELAKLRHSLELLRRERESAQKIVDVTRERLGAGLELPIEVTRAQLSAARVEQRIARLEGREETLESELRSLMGLPADQRIDVAAEELPSSADQPVSELVQLALANNPALKQAESERRAREQLWKGERSGYWPTVKLVGQYTIFSRINNYDDFYKKFVRHNVTVGLDVRIPIFSSGTSAAVALARTELNAAELELKTQRSNLEIEVRREARRTRELDAAREVARLELQLSQENLRVLQAQFQEIGRAHV